MKLVSKIGSIAFLVFLIIGCNDKKTTVTTQSGLTYSYLRNGEGDKVLPDHFLLLNVEYKDQNDSLWLSTIKNKKPIVYPIMDSIPASDGASIHEIFYSLVKGDSITFDMNAAQFFLNTYRMPLPRRYPNTTMFTFQIGVQDVFNKEEFELFQKIEKLKYEKRVAEETADQDSIEMTIIHDYIKENELSAQETESGLNYIIVEKGTGNKPTNGDRVRVNYTGKLLGGDYFDSSIKSIAEENGLYNPQREPYEPFVFTVGSGSVIQGWDEALRLLNEGDKATLIIPSKLGYGARSMGNKIPSYSILMFDIEFIEIINESNK